jgi:hypothetical protein
MVFPSDFESRSVSASQIIFGGNSSILDVSCLDSERGPRKDSKLMI